MALTFNPQPFDARLQRASLQPDAAQGQQQYSKEQDLPSMPLDEASQSKQTPLQLPAYPDGMSAARSLALHAKHKFTTACQNAYNCSQQQRTQNSQLTYKVPYAWSFYH